MAQTERRGTEATNEVDLTLVGLLKKYGPAHVVRPVKPGQTVAEVVGELGLNPDLVAIVMVNGRQGSKSDPLQPGDTVKLLPMVGGG
jgi:sulfur carrier protein ThiS